MEPLKGATVEPMSIGTLDELDGAASARRRQRFRAAAGACALLFMATLALRVVATRKPEDTQNIDGPANYMQPVQTVGLFNRATGRWLRVTDQGGADSPSMGPWQSEWQWERFELRQAAIYMQPVQTAGIEGIYDCTTMETIVVITATMDPNVVQIRGSFVKIDQNTLAYEMRRGSSPMVWHSVPSPQFDLLSKMWGGAPLRYEFEPGMGAFVSIAAGKPNTRYVKRSEHD